MAKLIRWVEAKPDISMPALAAKLEAEAKVIAHPASLSRALLAAGFKNKRTDLALECGRDDVCEARRRWRLHRQPRMREQAHREHRFLFTSACGGFQNRDQSLGAEQKDGSPLEAGEAARAAIAGEDLERV